jgi:hypothetical protein
MLRVFGFATLVLVAICLAVSAAIALADDSVPNGDVTPAATTTQDRIIEAVDPDHRIVDDSLVSAEDVYEFDFVVHSDAEPNPEFDEPSLLLEI